MDMTSQPDIASGPSPPPLETTLAKTKPASKAIAYYVANKARKKRLGVIPRG